MGFDKNLGCIDKVTFVLKPETWKVTHFKDVKGNVHTLAVFLLAWHKLVILDEEPQLRKMLSSDWPAGSVGHFLDWWVIWEDPAHCGMLVLSAIRKQTEQALESKPVSSTHPWPLRWWLPLVMEYDLSCKLTSASSSPVQMPILCVSIPPRPLSVCMFLCEYMCTHTTGHWRLTLAVFLSCFLH